MGKTEAMAECGGWCGSWCEGKGVRGCRLLVKTGWVVRVGDTDPPVKCCALRDAGVEVSIPDLTLMELVGEAGPEPQLLDVFAPTWTFFGWLIGSFRRPGVRGWWKRMGGSWEWWAKARARGVVAAAAWSGA